MPLCGQEARWWSSGDTTTMPPSATHFPTPPGGSCRCTSGSSPPVQSKGSTADSEHRPKLESKRAELSNQPRKYACRPHRQISAELRNHAPPYLHLSAQQLLLATPRDCLAILQQAVKLASRKTLRRRRPRP